MRNLMKKNCDLIFSLEFRITNIEELNLYCRLTICKPNPDLFQPKIIQLSPSQSTMQSLY